MSITTAAAMESSSGDSQNLSQLANMIHDGHMPTSDLQAAATTAQWEETTSSVNNYTSPVASGADLIAAAASAAAAAASATGNTIDTADNRVVKAQEGIIFRNPTINTATAANSKVHFISNLTLIAKQQQHQQATPRPGQNIIFLNNAPSQATTPVSPSKATTSTTSYINAFVSKGVATTATGKVVNLLHSGPKASSQLLTQQTHHRAKGGVQVLKRPPAHQQQQQLPQQQQRRHLNVVARSTGVLQSAAGALQAQKPQNIVIAGAAPPLLGSGKLIGPGAITYNTGAATMKVVSSACAVDPPKATSAKYARAGHVLAHSVAPKAKQLVSKYQPKVVQVQHPIHQNTSLSGNQVAYGAQWRVEDSTGGDESKGKGLLGKQQQHQQTMLLANSSSNGVPARVVRGGQGKLASSMASYVEQQKEGRGNGAIKYVNAQGTVVQQGPGSGIRLRDGSETAHNVIQFGGEQHKHGPAEEVYFVNGTQMSDEMSARLLQNFSQKAQTRFVAQTSSAAHQYPKHQYSVQQSASPSTYLGGQQQRQQGNDYSRANTSEIMHATTTTTSAASVGDNSNPTTRLADVRTDGNNNSGEVDGRGDDNHGVDMPPGPATATDERASALHAVLQDHTYVLLRTSDTKTGSGNYTATGSAGPSHVQYTSSTLDHHELDVAMALVDVSSRSNAQRQQQQQPVKCTTTDLLNAAMGLGHFPLSNQADDDNCSVISNDSRSGRTGDNDLGEETETAPEGDGEDDSVTRCICDLTHDDGYMICCDKCSTWQHVDCMGIDRLNIPDEYKCEVCCPRPMDKNRARTLQLLKRREQQNAALMHSMAMGHGAVGTPFVGSVPGGVPGVVHPPLTLEGRPMGVGGEAFNRNKLVTASPLKKAKAQLGARRKSELGAAFSLKKQKRDLLKNGGGKRKEKKLLTKKRTTSGTMGPGLTTTKPLMGLTGVVVPTAEERPAPKSWTDHYETAMTNHYSPELRARLQTISKQQQQQVLLSPTTGKAPLPGNGHLRNVGDLTGKCTTVPHAGGKILISTLELSPGEPIVELRGKYMLSGQFRQPGTMGLHRGPTQLGKPSGPFIFFYRMVNDATELCVDTRTYGNDARFVRRSCRPNAEIVHHLEKGTIHLYIVSLQPIRSSTEITIKHEPHDLLAVSRASASGALGMPQPTSTSCACGLVKDCLFYNATVVGVPDAMRQGKRPNGHPQKMRTTSTSRGTGGEEQQQLAGPLRRSSKANLRNSRSTSSSGESSACLMSPNITATSFHAPTSPMSPKTTITSSLPPQSHCRVAPVEQPAVVESVPTEIVPKKEEVQMVHVPKVASWDVAPDLPKVTAIKQEVDPPSVDPQVVVVEVQETPTDVAVVKEEVLEGDVHMPEECPPATTLAVKKEETEVKKEVVDCSGIDKQEGSLCTGDMSAEEGALKSPDTALAHKKNKELKSLNEENLKASVRGSCEESRKLTREERKMEAIMKAFEKMEKSSMRKQDGRKNGSSCGSEAGSKRRNSTSRRDGDDCSVFKKKKRKGSKSYQQASQRRIRRKSSTISQEDVFTSEESTGSLLASPPISVPYSYAPVNPMLPTRPHYDQCRFNGEQNSAANMLLSLANAAPAAEVGASSHTEPGRAMSSVYMLVEAAIAPLEASADFKVPKTKKSIMNDWLTADKAEESAREAMPPQPFESLLLAACGQVPQNLSTRGDEMVGSAGTDPQHTRTFVQETHLDHSDSRISAPFPTPPSTGGSESAVKKRWLRQAISEECSDEAPASPTNGYSATPLKKRRFAMDCSDDVSVTLFPQMPTTNTSPGVMCEQEPVEREAVTEATTNGDVQAHLNEEEQIEDVASAATATVISSPPTESVVATDMVTEESVAKEGTVIDERRESVTEEVPVEEQIKDEQAPVTEMEDQKQEEQEKKEEDPVPLAVTRDSIMTTESKEEDEVPAKEIIPEEFDIEPLHPEEKSPQVMHLIEDAASKSGAGSGEDASDEIADIQKRLHSFHAENILFLKSMNKKSKPNPSPQNSECLSAYSSASVSASSSATVSPSSSPKTSMAETLLRRHSTSSLGFTGKRKKLDFGADDDLESKESDEVRSLDLGSPEKRTKRRTKSRFSSPVRGDSQDLLKDLNSNTVGVVKDSADGPLPEDSTIPGTMFRAPEVSTPATHSYYTSAGPTTFGNGAGHHLHSNTMMSTPMSLINTSIPPPHMPYPTLFNNAFGVSTVEDTARTEPATMVGPVSSRLLLSELLENAQKINSQPLAETNPLASYSSAATVTSSCGASGFLSLNSAPPLSKMTFNSDVSLGSSIASPSLSSAGRSLIRTASADPRLNPNLNAAPETPPAPKRKLSINEYRKRMLQTPISGNESNSSSATASPTGFSRDAGGEKCHATVEGMEEVRVGQMEGGAESHVDPILDSLCDSNSCGSPPDCEGVDNATEKGIFSAAPTLLERQQESISERLKSYKSVTELLTTKDGTPIITTILQNPLGLGTSIIESLRSSISGCADDAVEEDTSEVAPTTTTECPTGEDAQPERDTEGESTESAMTTAAAAR